MEEGYLLGRVVGMAPAEDAEKMEGVVVKSLLAKAAEGRAAASNSSCSGRRRWIIGWG